MDIPKGWHIAYAPKPIPTAAHDWDWWHENVDIDNPMCGTAESREAAIESIKEWETDHA